jgi:transketolase
MFDFNVYVLCGDGDMMEGISGEAASLAAHHKLSNLCWIYDNNHITIEGNTSLAFTEDVAARFKAYGWNVAHVTDANDTGAIEKVLHQFNQTTDRPTFIVLDSHIGYGSPHKQDTREAHGEALGEDEIRLTKKNYGWPEDAKFLVPDGIYDQFKNGIGKHGGEARAAWMKQTEEYKAKWPELYDQMERMQKRQLPQGWDKDLPVFPADAKGLASRDSGGKVLNALAKNVPWLMGGSADLYPSTKTRLTFDGVGDFQADTRGGRNMHFGIREHSMCAIANGLALCKIRPFASTFFIFSDYCKPAIRLSAIMEVPVIYIFTHDSIGVGEDGPTHQPIEQLMALRAVPGLIVLRPADANEVLEAYKFTMQLHHEPVALVLTRQNLPTIDRTKYASAAGVTKGAYVLADAADGKPDVILMATGSEVDMALKAYEKLVAEGVKARLVSMPSWEIFEHQPKEYRESVLPPAVTARVSVEQAGTLGWDKYVGPKGRIIGMHTFGASAPLKELQKKFGFEPEAIVSAAKEVIANAKSGK